MRVENVDSPTLFFSDIKEEAKTWEKVDMEAGPASCFSVGEAAPPAPLPPDLQQLKKKLREEMAEEI